MMLGAAAFVVGAGLVVTVVSQHVFDSGGAAGHAIHVPVQTRILLFDQVLLNGIQVLTNGQIGLSLRWETDITVTIMLTLTTLRMLSFLDDGFCGGGCCRSLAAAAAAAVVIVIRFVLVLLCSRGLVAVLAHVVVVGSYSEV